MDDVIKSIHCPTCDMRHAPCFDQKRLCKRFVSTRLPAVLLGPNLTWPAALEVPRVHARGLTCLPLERRYQHRHKL